MKGYDPREAEGFIVERLRSSGLFPQQELQSVEPLVPRAIELDLQFIDQLQQPGAVEYYDEDDAFEAICDALVREQNADDEREMLIAQFVDAFMEYQEEYLEAHDLIAWDGE